MASSRRRATDRSRNSAVGSSEDGTRLVDNDRALLATRVDPRMASRVGQPLRLAVDPSRLFYFSPETGESLLADRS
ncbi:MAG TPA: hypothetical protein VGQ84_03490 [Gaiellaceae bacterium]|nr:hypothetical protein [Gaiellaceae bacterium]